MRTAAFFFPSLAALTTDNSTLVDRVGPPAGVDPPRIAYPRDYVKQQLGYSARYGVQ